MHPPPSTRRDVPRKQDADPPLLQEDEPSFPNVPRGGSIEPIMVRYWFRHQKRVAQQIAVAGEQWGNDA